MSFVKLNDGHNPDSTEVFLDTSIHCCFHKGKTLKPRLSWLLDLFSWKGTSTYSKLEYGNVILASAQYYLRELHKKGSVELVLEHISQVLTLQHHEKKTFAFNLIKTLGKSEEDRTRHAKASLRRLLKLGTAAIDAHCDHPLADGTQCNCVATSLCRGSDGTYTWKKPNCKSHSKACKVDNFFVEHRETFELIKKEIDKLEDDMLTMQLRQFSQVIGEALDNPSILLDYHNGCKLLADVIIAVESKGFRSFATQNYKESQVLTRILDQRCYYLPNNPEHGVQILDHNTVTTEEGHESALQEKG